jgi:NitT/TauT family transport system ATP-binding protein
MTRIRRDGLLPGTSHRAKAEERAVITHSIDEALYLADRIIVMSERPGRMIAEFVVPFERPRETEMRTLPQFHAIADEIWRLLRPHDDRDRATPDPIRSDATRDTTTSTQEETP